ncbi:DNA topoisomerase [Vibrio breoganii]
MKLIISEKSSVTKDLAKAMGWQMKSGVAEGSFEGDKVIVVSASGHLVKLQSPNAIRPEISWQDPKTLIPIPNDYNLVPVANVKGKPTHLQPEATLKKFKSLYYKHKVDEVIIATDSDREGEAIGWEIINFIGHTGKVRRAWFAAGVDERSLKDAMNNLRDPNITKSWWRSSEARGRADYSYILLTMAYTFYAQYGKFGRSLSQGKGREGVVSVGRVQTPTVAMIAQRDAEIKSFIKRNHFKVTASFGEGQGIVGKYSPTVTQATIDANPEGVHWEQSKTIPKDGEPLPLEEPLFIDARKVDDFIKRLKDIGSGTVTKYEEGERKENPPKTFDLPSAQGALATLCGLKASIGQTLLEDLYEQGYISYARTSKSDIPQNYHLDERRNEMLDTMLELPEISKHAQEVKDIHNNNHPSIKGGFIPATYSKKDMEHHGIVPTTEIMTLKAFNGLSPRKGKGYTGDHMRKAYIAVCKQYIQALYPPATYATQSIMIEVTTPDLLNKPTTTFKLNSERAIDAGWRLAFKGKKEDSTLPQLTVGQAIPLVEAMKKAQTTKPPERYSQKTLPLAMANIGKKSTNPKLRKLLANSEGIGTPATRSGIIENITRRGYVESVKEQFYITQKGIDMIAAVPDALKNFETTALWEDVLVQITEQKDDSKSIPLRDSFVIKQTSNVEQIIQNLIEAYDGNLGEKIAQAPSKVSPAMKKAIEAIAKSLNLPLERGTLTDPLKAKEFLDAHAGKINTKPSEKQLEFAKRLESNVESASLTPEILESRKKISEFINQYAPLEKRPATPKQVSLLKELLQNNTSTYECNPLAFSDFNECSKAIEDLQKITIRPPSQKQIDFVNKIAKEQGIDDVPEDVYANRNATSQWIDKHMGKSKTKQSSSTPSKKSTESTTTSNPTSAQPKKPAISRKTMKYIQKQNIKKKRREEYKANQDSE